MLQNNVEFWKMNASTAEASVRELEVQVAETESLRMQLESAEQNMQEILEVQLMETESLRKQLEDAEKQRQQMESRWGEMKAVSIRLHDMNEDTLRCVVDGFRDEQNWERVFMVSNKIASPHHMRGLYDQCFNILKDGYHGGFDECFSYLVELFPNMDEHFKYWSPDPIKRQHGYY